MRLEQPHKSCNKICSQKGESKHHKIKTWYNSKTSKCLICYQTFSQKSDLKKHDDLILKIKDLHNCSICDKSFSHKCNKKHVW